MEGIKIVSEYVSDYRMTLSTIVFILGGIYIAIGIYDRKNLSKKSTIVNITIACMIIGFGVFIKTMDAPARIYKVDISEEVNFIEFTNAYQVLEKQDDMYIVKEKR